MLSIVRIHIHTHTHTIVHVEERSHGSHGGSAHARSAWGQVIHHEVVISHLHLMTPRQPPCARVEGGDEDHFVIADLGSRTGRQSGWYRVEASEGELRRVRARRGE